jgi:hypothetical protein
MRAMQIGSCDSGGSTPTGQFGAETAVQDRARSGVVDIVLDDVEDKQQVAQGGLGVVFRGVWRGCEVAVKRPVDPRAGCNPKLKAEFTREVECVSPCICRMWRR